MRLRTTAMLVLFVALAQPAAAQRWQAAERPLGVQLSEPEVDIAQLVGRTRVKSKTRMTIGGALMIFGVAIALSSYSACEVAGPDADRYDPPPKASWDTDAGECVLNGRPSRAAPQVWAERKLDPEVLWGGVGTAVLGVLLATVWSEVDANETVAFRPRPDGGVEVSKRINIW